MSITTSAPPTGRRAILLAALGALVTTAAIIGLVVFQPDSSAARSRPADPAPGLATQAPMGEGAVIAGDGALTEADGALPEGASAFDGYAGIANLDPELLEALQLATSDAAGIGIELRINSGWRSADLQERLLSDAVAEYGSREEAARWVATAETSAHVRGAAVDVGDADAAAWLAEQGSVYGLCQIYANEPWHFELSPAAAAVGCPAMFADPSEDPRMQG